MLDNIPYCCFSHALHLLAARALSEHIATASDEIRLESPDFQLTSSDASARKDDHMLFLWNDKINSDVLPWTLAHRSSYTCLCIINHRWKLLLYGYGSSRRRGSFSIDCSGVAIFRRFIDSRQAVHAWYLIFSRNTAVQFVAGNDFVQIGFAGFQIRWLAILANDGYFPQICKCSLII